MTKTVSWNKEKLMKDIEEFEFVFPITDDMHTVRDGVSRMIMLERYAYKDIQGSTLGPGDLVITIVKNDPNYPIKGIGVVQKINKNTVDILLEEQYRGSIPDEKEAETGVVRRSKNEVNKPLEIYYEQIAKRVAKGLSNPEENESDKDSEQEKQNIKNENNDTIYILNTNTMKFHNEECSSVKDIKPQNKETFNGTKAWLMDNGYSPCGVCNP